MDVPNVFHGPFQSCPLDIATQDFYLNRQQVTDERLEWLKNASIEVSFNEKLVLDCMLFFIDNFSFSDQLLPVLHSYIVIFLLFVGSSLSINNEFSLCTTTHHVY
jgi:hypothetical protein